MLSALAFNDYFPQPPYSDLFTRSNELQLSPLEPFLSAVTQLPAPAIALYQVVLEPVSPEHNWYLNVQALTDLQYVSRLFGGAQAPQRYAQQAPSGGLRSMAMDVDTKAHNDKPFFAAAVRVGLLGGPASLQQDMLRALSTFMGLFLHGGRPLDRITEKTYQSELAEDRVQAMFLAGNTHRPGFLLNSSELAGFVHVPPLAWLEDSGARVDVRDVFRKPRESLVGGTEIGETVMGGVKKKITIPPALRACHVHIIGSPGGGKSSLMLHMSLGDAERGDGLALIDPHGDLAEDLLCSLPKECIDRTIYFEPGNQEWIPVWNPLVIRGDQDVSIATDEVVAAIKSIADGWGDRLGTLLRQAVSGLIRVPGATLLDVAMVLKPKPRDGNTRRKRIRDAATTQLGREFWGYDIENYAKGDFNPAQHKLDKLMGAESVELMFSQPDSRIDFRKIMDKSLIFIANLSKVGPESKEVMGKFILSFIYLAALSRNAVPREELRPFHVFADEAHCFVGGSAEDLIAQTRKYNVSLILAHQYLHQFSRETTDALGTVGTTIAFGIQHSDAERMARAFGKQVTPEDLSRLRVGEAIVRVRGDLLRVETPYPCQTPNPEVRRAILENSHNRYCRRAHEIQSEIARKFGRYERRFGPENDLEVTDNAEAFAYAEL